MAIIVPTNDLFSAETQDHLRWWAFHRNIFAWAAEDCFSLRIVQNDCLASYVAWRDMGKRKELLELNLEKGEEIPLPVEAQMRAAGVRIRKRARQSARGAYI